MMVMMIIIINVARNVTNSAAKIFKKKRYACGWYIFKKTRTETVSFAGTG